MKRTDESGLGNDVWSLAMTFLVALTERAGAWVGTNGFRLMPSDPLHEAPATADVSVAAGGTLVTIAYAWSHPGDGPQDGLLVVGAADDPDAVSAFWGDSWHQSPTPRQCTGTANGAVITVGYAYDAGWRWQITVDPTDAATLRLQMDNVAPDDVEGAPTGAYPAMITELRRSP